MRNKISQHRAELMRAELTRIAQVNKTWAGVHVMSIMLGDPARAAIKTADKLGYFCTINEQGEIRAFRKVEMVSHEQK